MFPCEIFEFFNSERFDVIQFIFVNAMFDRFYVSFFKTHEKDIENRSYDMKMLSKRQKTEKKEKGQVMNEIRYNMNSLQRSI